MTLHRFTILAALWAGLCVAGYAQEVAPMPREVHGIQPFHATVAGICMNKDDFAFTKTPLFSVPTGGALRIYCDLTGESTHGRLTFQAVAEEDFSPNSCTLAGGLSGGFQFPLSGYSIVITFASQEQLYLKLVSGSECANAAISPIGIGQSTLKVVGGTGRFAGASGSVSHSWRDGDLFELSPFGGDSFFASYNGTIDGFITLQ